MGTDPKINPKNVDVKHLIQELKRRRMDREDIGRAIRNLRERPKINPVIHDYGSGHLKAGFIGDTHFGNKWTDKPFLHRIYKKFQEEGVTAVYHTGDIADGMDMFKGHSSELYAWGISAIVDDIINDYPSIPGVNTFYILGNHDLSYKKASGSHLGHLLTNMNGKRPDLVFVGNQELPDKAVVLLGPDGKTRMELIHPGGGTAYAQSYNQQRQIENLISEEKPNLMFFGHYHKLDYLFYRNVHAFQTGTSERQTGFMASKNLVPQMGGLVIDIHMKPSGEVDKLSYKYVRPE